MAKKNKDKRFITYKRNGVLMRVPVSNKPILGNNNLMNPTPKTSDFWEIPKEETSEIIKECSKISNKNVVIKVAPIVKMKIEALMEKYTSKEWLAYLIGNNYIIDDIIIPNQKVTSGNVTDIDLPENVSICGVIHSHHNMGSFFSHTDYEFINSNHDISIVVSNGNGNISMKCDVRVKTPCGGNFITEAKVELLCIADFNKDDFLKTADERIKDKYITRSGGQCCEENWDHLGYGWDGYGVPVNVTEAPITNKKPVSCQTSMTEAEIEEALSELDIEFSDEEKEETVLVKQENGMYKKIPMSMIKNLNVEDRKKAKLVNLRTLLKICSNKVTDDGIVLHTPDNKDFVIPNDAIHYFLMNDYIVEIINQDEQNETYTVYLPNIKNQIVIPKLFIQEEK